MSSDNLPALREYPVQELEVMAGRVAKSRLFGLDTDQAFTLMLLAQAEGIHPVKAMQRYHVVQGRPAMKSDAMLADFLRCGGTVEWVTESDDREKCEAVFRHPQFYPKGKAVRFTFDDAKRANLAQKEVWKQYPSNMMRARVISTGIRMIAPGIVAGLYTPEEIGDIAPIEAVARVIEPPPPKEHHAINHPNGTGHGSGAYAPPEDVTSYTAWLIDFCDGINSKWIDYLTHPDGEIRKGPGLVCNTFQLGGHLYKFARENNWVNCPEEIRSGQRDKFTAVAFSGEHNNELIAEAKTYCRSLWREAQAKVKPDPVPAGVPEEEDGDESDYVDTTTIEELAEEGREPGSDG